MHVSTYVYGFTHSSHPLRIDGMTGVGAQAPTLRVVQADGLAAVVSDAPDDLRPRRRDLEAHHRILQALGAEGTVLPMSFGMVASDDSAIRKELMSAADHYGTLLARLAGKVELNVKAAHRQASILRALLLQHQPLRARNDALRAMGGGSHADRVRFGEQLATALADRCVRDAGCILNRLEPHACQTRLGPEAGGFLNASFLVAAAARQSFETAFAALRRDLSDLAEIRLFGPLPPYSFVDTPRPSEPPPWVC
jgi:hypothetical protein